MTDFTKPGTTLPNGAIVIDTKGEHLKFVSVLAILPANTATPWAIWSTLVRETGECFSGTYCYTFTEATERWSSK